MNVIRLREIMTKFLSISLQLLVLWNRDRLDICHDNIDRLATSLQRCLSGKEAAEWRIIICPQEGKYYKDREW